MGKNLFFIRKLFITIYNEISIILLTFCMAIVSDCNKLDIICSILIDLII